MEKIDFRNLEYYRNNILTEEFIEIHENEVDWNYISKYQKLSESFIEKYENKVDFEYISICQNLSELFIEKYENEVKWNYISQYQKLSESFIEKYKNKVDWYYISKYQKLSESFIKKHENKVYWDYISEFQKLSESFIEKYENKVDWDYISWFQKLSESFIEKHKDKISIDKDNWLYKDAKEKLEFIYSLFPNAPISEDKKSIIAYKGIRSDNYSSFNFQYKYEKGNVYESHCNCTNSEYSFGLGAYIDIEKAREYCNQKIIKVHIDINDIGRVLKCGKIRTFKFRVLDVIEG